MIVFKYLFLILMISLSSCGTYYYYPTHQNVLRFDEKNDLNVSCVVDQEYTAFNVGYAPFNNIAFISDFKYFDRYRKDYGWKYTIDDYMWDNEVILFKKFDKVYLVAVNIGSGFGQIDRNEEDFQLKCNRQYIQPSIGFTNDYVDIAFSSRISRVAYNLKQSSSFKSYNYPLEELYFLYDVGKRDFCFFEPAFTLGLGYKFIKLRYQYISSQKISDGKIRYYDKTFNLSIHTTIKINR